MPVVPKHKAGRNELCSCGSKLKSKFCHNDPVKQMICTRVANERMANLILQEQKKRGIVEWTYVCNVCGNGCDELKQSQIVNSMVCPECGSPDIQDNSVENVNQKSGGQDEVEED